MALSLATNRSKRGACDILKERHMPHRFCLAIRSQFARNAAAKKDCTCCCSWHFFFFFSFYKNPNAMRKKRHHNVMEKAKAICCHP